MNTAVRDLYAETTTRIVTALKQGTAPWVKPLSTGVDTLPMNGGTRRPYRGVNVLLLELEATAHGYPLQRWPTYRQALELGGQVRKGEHGATVVLWHLHKREVEEPADPEPRTKVIPLLLIRVHAGMTGFEIHVRPFEPEHVRLPQPGGQGEEHDVPLMHRQFAQQRLKGPWGPHMEAPIPIPRAHATFGERAMVRAAEMIYDLPE